VIVLEKTTVLILFGGQSSEHEISLRSAATVISNMDYDKYAVLKMGITRDGHWMLTRANAQQIASGEWETLSDNHAAFVPPDAKIGGIFVLNDENSYDVVKIDVAFAVLHGMYGEDGSIQGLFELANIPYVGCGITASAICMDKVYCKMILDSVGVNQAKWMYFTARELSMAFKSCVAHAEQFAPYPLYVKPSCAGSSVGVSRVTNTEELTAALKLAAKYDTKVIVEEEIVGRELEISIIGTKNPFASWCCEIIKGRQVYDYDAKYNNDSTETHAIADMDMEIMDDVRMVALKVYSTLGCTGMSRADFFYDEKNKKIVFNEMNTIPGFTPKSMFPKMLEATWGFSLPAQFEMLFEAAIEQRKQRSALQI